jgi:hypothetical protein
MEIVSLWNQASLWSQKGRRIEVERSRIPNNAILSLWSRDCRQTRNEWRRRRRKPIRVKFWENIVVIDENSFGTSGNKTRPEIRIKRTIVVKQSTAFRIRYSGEFIIIYNMVLRAHMTSAKVKNETDIRGMLWRVTQKFGTARSRNPFRNFLVVLEFGIEDVCWTSPNVKTAEMVVVREASLCEKLNWRQHG